MINFELFIEGYKADVNTDLPAMLTFAIDDVSNFAARSTTFSKTIVLPGTARNNALLGNIFDFNTANTTDDDLPNIAYNYNAFNPADILIFQNNIQCLKGSMRLLKIINDKGRMEYEVAVFGELNAFISYAAGHLLEELDFSAYNTTFDETAISTSWDNTPGSGVYWPLIDYGTYSVAKHDWEIKTFRPALYVKEYVDKIFEAADFTYSSTLFNTARFKSLIVPHNQKQLLTKTSRILYANETGSHLLIDTVGGDTTMQAVWDYIQSGAFTYAEDAFGGDFTYNDPTSIATTIEWQLSGQRSASTFGNFYIEIRVNSVAVATSSIFTIPPGGGPVSYVWTGSVNVTLNQNDVLDAYYVYGGTGTNVQVTIAPTSWFIVNATNPTYVPVSYGQDVTINDSIPKNIRQLDFIAGLIKLFNLYIWEDKFDERKLFIEPYTDFYDLDPANAVDWSYKLNRDKPVTIKPLSELTSRYYNFKYKDDSDYYNDLYKKRYNQTYGSRIYDSTYQFGDNSNNLEIIFSGTPLVGYGGEDKVYSTIFKLSSTNEETIDSNIRILQTKKITGVTSWDILNSAVTLDSYTDYGYAGHLDDPDAPTNDLNFGAPLELFFTLVSGDLSANQFNVYWSPYMAEITSQHSKLVSGSFRLTAMDIFNLDFSKFVYLDGSLFRLNKIEDYNATIEDECKVELLKVINTQY